MNPIARPPAPSPPCTRWIETSHRSHHRRYLGSAIAGPVEAAARAAVGRDFMLAKRGHVDGAITNEAEGSAAWPRWEGLVRCRPAREHPSARAVLHQLGGIVQISCRVVATPTRPHRRFSKEERANARTSAQRLRCWGAVHLTPSTMTATATMPRGTTIRAGPDHSIPNSS